MWGRLLIVAVSAIFIADAAAYEWDKITNGVVVGEGKDVGFATGTCDLECCKAKCDAEPRCNSFAHASGNCYLKDKCVSATEKTKKSAYRTYFRQGPCPRSAETAKADAAAALEAASSAAANEAPAPSRAKVEYAYPPPAPFPKEAGSALPKLYREPRSSAPWAALPKNVYDAHCDFLDKSGIEWIVVLGDSVARAFGVALMEHLAGDDVHFCDAANGPPQVLGDKKYLNDKKYKEYRRQTCPAGYEIFTEGLNPEVNSPLEARVCGGKVKVTTVEIWEYEHIEERLIPFLRGEAIDFGILGKPDLVVSSIFRSVRYVTRYQKYPGLVKWFEKLFQAAKDEGMRQIYVGMHERNMRKVPKIFHKTQNNTHCALANQAAWEAAEAVGTSVVDLFNITNNEELWMDTSDGTHVGWKANLVKVDRLLRAIPNSRYPDDSRFGDAEKGHSEL